MFQQSENENKEGFVTTNWYIFKIRELKLFQHCEKCLSGSISFSTNWYMLMWKYKNLSCVSTKWEMLTWTSRNKNNFFPSKQLNRIITVTDLWQYSNFRKSLLSKNIYLLVATCMPESAGIMPNAERWALHACKCPFIHHLFSYRANAWGKKHLC